MRFWTFDVPVMAAIYAWDVIRGVDHEARYWQERDRKEKECNCQG